MRERKTTRYMKQNIKTGAEDEREARGIVMRVTALCRELDVLNPFLSESLPKERTQGHRSQVVKPQSHQPEAEFGHGDKTSCFQMHLGSPRSYQRSPLKKNHIFCECNIALTEL